LLITGLVVALTEDKDYIELVRSRRRWVLCLAYHALWRTSRPALPPQTTTRSCLTRPLRVRAPQLHRTFTHSIPLILLFTLLAVARCRHWPSAHAHSDCPSPDAECNRVWRSLLWLAGGDACCGAAVAAVLGACCGCLGHTLIDIFYIVPVQLFWPLPREFSYPLLLPAKSDFTNRLFKLAMLGDYASDFLYVLPLLFVCHKYALHEGAWRRFGAFWAGQAAVLFAHLHPALMCDSYHHEDFIYWLHMPCGMLFMLILFASPLLLRDAVHCLSSPADPAWRQKTAKALRGAADAPAETARAAHSSAEGLALYERPDGGAASPASSGGSAPSLTPAPHAGSPPSRTRPRTLRRFSSWDAGDGEPRPLHKRAASSLQRRQTGASAASFFRGALGADSDEQGEECSSPQRGRRRGGSFTVTAA